MKILVIHASAGAGHKTTAQALYNGFTKIAGYDVVLVDALDFTNPFFKKFYLGSFQFLISKMPWLWSFGYWLLELSWLKNPAQGFRRILNLFNARKLHRFLIREQFDHVVTTHFLATEVAAALKRSGKISSKVTAVLTDYEIHSLWLSKGVDMYAVACDWTKRKLQRLGVREEQVFVSGVPTDDKFCASWDIHQLKRKLGLKENIFTVLMMAGSFGIGPIEEVIETLSEEFQVIVVCSRNESLYQRLSSRNDRRLKILGHVNNVHELMAVSDVIVTKPGGPSIAEALVNELPLIFFVVIKGHELGNVKILAKYGIGINGRNAAQIGAELTKMKDSRETFRTMVQKTKTLARPSAVRDIVSSVL